MKHSPKLTIILISLFIITQIIGLLVVHIYSTNQIPYGLNPPQDVSPISTLAQFIFSLAVVLLLIFGLMKLKSEIIFRVWFFVVVIVALGVTFSAFLINIPNASLISIVIALPLAYLKIFKRNIIVHNLTELLVYPGIAALFVPILSVWSAVVLLVIISLYDMYAVWKAGFMQKMAKYQIQKVRVFSGFFIPYLKPGQKAVMLKAKTKSALKRVKVSVALLGGGDIVFPIILAGTVLLSRGLLAALIVSLGASIGLAALLYNSEKGKFYPAMPFISLGAFVGLALQFLL